MKKLQVFVFFLMVSTGLILAQSVNVTSPAAGVIWYKGTLQTITWTSPGCQSGDVKINIFKDSVSTANFVLQLTGPNTGSKSWTVPNNFQDGNYIIRVKTEPAEEGCLGDSPIFTIKASTEPEAGNLEAHLTTNLKPDLKVTIIPNHNPYRVHQKAFIEFRVENIGKWESPATKLKIFRGAANKYTWDIQELKPGESFSNTISIFCDFIGYTLWTAKVDEPNHIIESNELNNIATYKMVVNASDLVVAFNRGYGVQITVLGTYKAYIKNIGHARSRPCKLKFYMAKKGTKIYDIPALDPGSWFKVERSETYWIAKQRPKMSMTIDWEGDVKEENEKNNHVEEFFFIHVFKVTKQSYSYICSNGKTGATLNEVW